MRRIFARLGLLCMLAGVPVALGALVGPPTAPDFAGSDGLSGSFVPVESVLRLIGLLAWGLWMYLAFAVLLHVAATLATGTDVRGHQTLNAVSCVVSPRIVRGMVELALGGVLVAAAMSVRAPPVPAARAQVFDAAPARHEGYAIDTAGRSQEKHAYRVRSGDSLWRIAERELGSGFRWREIFRINEGKRFSDGSSLTDPHLIHPGWVLDLPHDDRSSPRTDDDRSHDRTSPRKGIAESSPSASFTPPPTPAHESPAEPSMEEPAFDDEADESEGSQPAGPTVEIPSGLLVAASFASGLLMAHLLGRLHRRRSRRLTGLASVEPAAPTPELIHDLRRAGASEMAGPLDVALDVLIEAWKEHAGTWPHVVGALESPRHVRLFLRAGDVELPRPSGGTVSPRLRFARAGPMVVAEVEGPFPVQARASSTPLERALLVPLGRAPGGPVLHLSATGIGLLAITGREGVGLARQMVLAAATQGGPDDLRLALLGYEGTGSLRALPQVAASCAWEKASEEIRQIELEVLSRSRLFLQEGVQDIFRHLAEHSDERLPAMLVVCEEPPPGLQGRVKALGQQASRVGIAFIALGWTPSGAAVVANVRPPVDLETDIPMPKAVEPFLLDARAEQEAIAVVVAAHLPPQEEEPAPAAVPEIVQEASVPDSVDIRTASEGSSRVIQVERSSPGRGEPPEPPADVAAIRCLGPFEMSRGGQPVHVAKAKSREMIAYLVANRSGAPKDRIIEELWPEIDPKVGAARFDRCATVARSWARGTEDSRMYIERTNGTTYRLEQGAWWVDAWEFGRLIREAEGAQGSPEAVDRIQAALALYRGEFCDDAYYPWAEGVRERYRNLFIEASARLAYLLSDAGDHDKALAVLDRAIDVDPVCEDLVRRAMAEEAALGRRPAALARYRTLEATLDERLGADPDPETQAMVQNLLRASASTG